MTAYGGQGVSYGIFFATLIIVAAAAGVGEYAIGSQNGASDARKQCDQANSQTLHGLSKVVQKVRNWVEGGRNDKILAFLRLLNSLRQTYFQARDYIDAFAWLTQPPPPANASRTDLLAYADFQSRNINTIFGQANDFKDLVQQLLVDSSNLLADP